jgi:hypothetical protein
VRRVGRCAIAALKGVFLAGWERAAKGAWRGLPCCRTRWNRTMISSTGDPTNRVHSRRQLAGHVPLTPRLRDDMTQTASTARLGSNARVIERRMLSAIGPFTWTRVRRRNWRLVRPVSSACVRRQTRAVGTMATQRHELWSP